MKYKCGNCGRIADEKKLPYAEDIHMRLEPGEIYTDRQCPKCGALCYPHETGDRSPMTSGEIEAETQKIQDAIWKLAKRLKRQGDHAGLWVEPARDSTVIAGPRGVCVDIGVGRKKEKPCRD